MGIKLFILVFLFAFAEMDAQAGTELEMSCHTAMPLRFASATAQTKNILSTAALYNGMVLIQGGDFLMGAVDDKGRRDEYPQHKVNSIFFLHGYY
jgi:formylglycine-generating enzyme required for sulfatase activity